MAAIEPTDDELRAKIKEMVPKIDLHKTGMKEFVTLVAKEMGMVDLKHRKDFIKQALTDAINEQGSDDDDDDDEDDESDASSVEEKAPKKKRGGGGFGGKKEISDDLAEFLGQGKEMSRPEIVKAMWEHIRTNNLQNPENKREIVLDEGMKKVFGCDKFTMFTMNKYIGAHIHPFKPVDLTSAPKKSPAAKKRKAKKGAASGEKKKRKAGSQPPYRLSGELQAVVGTDILPRPQVVSKIWVYIKANNLQNEKDKREILCDDKLQAVFKRKKISMFKMNAEIGRHLVEKLDKSEYQHEEEEDDDNVGGAASDDDNSDSE